MEAVHVGSRRKADPQEALDAIRRFLRNEHTYDLPPDVVVGLQKIKRDLREQLRTGVATDPAAKPPS